MNYSEPGVAIRGSFEPFITDVFTDAGLVRLGSVGTRLGGGGARPVQ
jgi:hypothetical protein